jgi:hypothetical protein
MATKKKVVPAPRQRIFKTEVDASIGFSVQTPDGDWVKSNVRLCTHIGPGFPSDAMLSKVLTVQVSKAYEGSADQIALLVSKLNSETGSG